jgi:hypothetical protein
MEIFEREEEGSESKNWFLLEALNAVQTKTFSVWTNSRTWRRAAPLLLQPEGVTHQPPKPPSRLHLLTNFFLDISKSLENSKNPPDYREYSKYCASRVNSSNL